MPRFEAVATVQQPAERIFDFLADGANLRRWGPGADEDRIEVRHRHGPQRGQGAGYDVLRHLGAHAIAHYAVTVSECERPRKLVLRSPLSFDVAFSLEPLGPSTTRVSCARTYRERAPRMLPRMFALEVKPATAEAAISRDLERIAAQLRPGGDGPCPSEGRASRPPVRRASLP